MNILNYLPQLGLKPNLVNGMLFSSFASSVPTAPLVYLLRDEFSTDEAAPLASPRTCEPGPETLTITDTGNNVSVASSRLRFSGGTSNGAQTALVGPSFTRRAGLALLVDVVAKTSGLSCSLKWWSAATPTAHSNSIAGLRFDPDAPLSINANINSTEISTSLNPQTALPVTGAVILRSAGAFLVRNKDGVGQLEWVDNLMTTTPLYPIVDNYSAIVDLDSLRVLDLPAPWDTDYGIATQRLAGSVSAGTTFTHTANCLIEWTQTTLNSAGNTLIHFRRQDASNYWQIAVSSTGALILNEVVAGTPTQRATAAAGIASGHRIVIIADGTIIRGYSNNVLRWTYASATNFQTATAGELNSLGTGGAVSDLITWPRTVALPGGL